MGGGLIAEFMTHATSDESSQQGPKSHNRSFAKGCLAALLVAIVGVLWLSHKMAHAPKVVCISNMRHISLAGRMWASDHTNRLPSDFLEFTNELVTPRVLHCPEDKEHAAVTTWAALKTAGSSYIFAPGPVDNDSTNQFIRCLYHDHIGMADGRVLWPEPGSVAH